MDLISLLDPQALRDTQGSAQLLLAFGLGFLSSLTPCVYPLIPITLAIFGVDSKLSKRHSFFLACCYVLGIASTYTALGVFSALTGALFGSLLTNPYVLASLSALLFFLALSTLDIIPFPISSKMQAHANRIGGRGYLGAYLMGLVSGVIAAPCIGPVIVVILSIAAFSQQVFWGGALLFSYSIGLGIIFILLGTFSGLLRQLPKSGSWLKGVKFVMALAIMLMAIILVSPLLSKIELYNQLTLSWTSALSTILLAFLALLCSTKVRSLAKASELLKGLSAFLLASSLFFIYTINSSSSEIAWIKNFEEALSVSATNQDQNKHNIVMLDLYADWCAACKEFDAITFKDPRVVAALSRYVTAKFDLTLESPEGEKIQERYNVVGLPCILFLNPDGSEISNTRISGFLNAEQFLEHLEKVNSYLAH